MKLNNALSSTGRKILSGSPKYSRKDFLKLSFLVAGSFALSSSIGGQSYFSGESRKSNINNGRKAIVVGAGISGLTTAKKLQEFGWDVEVWEGRNRIGGRIHTFRGWDYAMDLGASWIHGIDKNPIYSIAKKENLKLHKTDFTKAIFYKDGTSLSYWTMLRSIWNYSALMDEMEDFMIKSSKDLSLREVFNKVISQKNLPDDRKDVVSWLYHWLENDIAEDGDKISARAVFMGDEGFEGDEVIFEDGYEGIVKYLSEGLNIKTGMVVGRVEQSKQGVVVHSKKSSSKFDIAIVTVPLGVLQKNRIGFSPDLPSIKKKSISSLGMGLLNKLYVEFKEPFWATDKHIIGISEKKHFFDGFINLYPFLNKPTLIGFTHGTRARELENWDLAKMKSFVGDTFSHTFQRKIPEPLRVFPTRWDKDPFSFGSYSHIPLGGSFQDIENLSQPFGNIYFAGEHTSPEYFGYVHGAFLTGIREAERINKTVSTQ